MRVANFLLPYFCSVFSSCWVENLLSSDSPPIMQGSTSQLIDGGIVPLLFCVSCNSFGISGRCVFLHKYDT